MPAAGHGVVVIGAGPAGLAAGHALSQAGARPLILERSDKVGGLSRTEAYKGFLFDVGGHRFYTRNDDVWSLWQELLGEDFITVQRLSRIYYNERFFRYPLRPLDTLRQLGLMESMRIASSYASARLRPYPLPANFEQWTINRFGRRLYEIFFKSYTEKVWGIPCDRIAADWADLRIGNLSLGKALRNACFGQGGSKSLIEEFHYPVRGPGMIWARLRERIVAAGGQVRLGAEVVGLQHEGWRIRGLTLRSHGVLEEVDCDEVITSMPLADLILGLRPPPPAEVAQAARNLRHRAFIMVGLIVNRANLFPDNWIYVHSPAVRVGRIQNFRNWSPALVPVPDKTSVGMEYFCDVGDAIWSRSDAELIALARGELAALGLIRDGAVEDGTVVRETAAYPLYSRGYERDVQTIRQFLKRFENLQTIGRNGTHRYNNQDHSMLAGLLAARNILGESHDLWSVDIDALESGRGRASTALPRLPRASTRASRCDPPE